MIKDIKKIKGFKVIKKDNLIVYICIDGLR